MLILFHKHITSLITGPAWNLNLDAFWHNQILYSMNIIILCTSYAISLQIRSVGDSYLVLSDKFTRYLMLKQYSIVLLVLIIHISTCLSSCYQCIFIVQQYFPIYAWFTFLNCNEFQLNWNCADNIGKTCM